MREIRNYDQLGREYDDYCDKLKRSELAFFKRSLSTCENEKDLEQLKEWIAELEDELKCGAD